MTATSPAQTSALPERVLWLSRLSLGGFRNFREVELALEPRPVLLTGPNGAGKTNLLEAVLPVEPPAAGCAVRDSATWTAGPGGRELGNAAPGDPAAGLAGWAVAATVETPRGAAPGGAPAAIPGPPPAGAREAGGQAGRRLRRQPAGAGRGGALRLADAADGPSVRGGAGRPTPLPSTAWSTASTRPTRAASPPTRRRCASARACSGRGAGTRPGWARWRRPWRRRRWRSPPPGARPSAGWPAP